MVSKSLFGLTLMPLAFAWNITFYDSNSYDYGSWGAPRDLIQGNCDLGCTKINGNPNADIDWWPGELPNDGSYGGPYIDLPNESCCIRLYSSADCTENSKKTAAVSYCLHSKVNAGELRLPSFAVSGCTLNTKCYAKRP